ncbi:MAG: M48 family metallopeptidase [Bacillota bacterium]
MLSRSKKILILLLVISFLLMISFSVNAVSDLEREVAQKNLETYINKYGIAELSARQEKEIKNLFKQLANAAQQDAPNLEFKLHILDTKRVNAVYIGDGHVMLFKGLIELVDSNQQVAAVIAHELGHGIKGHIQEQINLQQGIQLGAVLIDLVGDGKLDQKEPDLLTQLGLKLILSDYSRSQEREADEYSVLVSARAGIDPNATVKLMESLNDNKESSDSKLLELFQNHPNTTTRIDYLSDMVTRIKQADKLYYKPTVTAQRLADALLANKEEAVYDTYAPSVHQRLSLAEFSSQKQYQQLRSQLQQLEQQSAQLHYKAELRNQVEGTARVALEFKSGSDRLYLGLDLIKSNYGWRVLRVPKSY